MLASTERTLAMFDMSSAKDAIVCIQRDYKRGAEIFSESEPAEYVYAT